MEVGGCKQGYASISVLNLMRAATGSQCNEMKRGVTPMCYTSNRDNIPGGEREEKKNCGYNHNNVYMIIYNIYKSSVCCFTHMHTDINVFHTQHNLVVRSKKSSDVPITTKDNTLLNLF